MTDPRVAIAADVDRLAEAMAAAFNDDPIFTWLLPNASARPARLKRFFTLELRHVVLPVGNIWTTDPTVGASLELGTGQWRMPLAAQIAHGRSFARVFGRRLAIAMALITKMEHRHPREQHYYIPYVGIAPPAQGRGLGATLITKTLERCDAERLPAYLEATSERNVALYERLAFQHLGPFSLGNSPPLWPMRRPTP